MKVSDSERRSRPSTDLPPRYDAAAVEPRIYARWLDAGAFTPSNEVPGGERFVVIMPPPNVTGSLHNGHALTATVEDTLVRYHRARGDDTLWLPGVDHASIAAQYVLDRIIAAEGETRTSLGRDRYLDRMWRYMDETRGVITRQFHKLGASADWTRERFTMDEDSARAVRVAFKRLWDAELAYRAEALINWCPRCMTSISDLENVRREEHGTLWTIRYHLERDDGTPDPEAWIAVATTRPETLLGDVAVAVHPDDERFRALAGRHVMLPFLGRRLPIVADDAVDRAFGTGAVKITPAHDPDDYELGKRHGLTAINVFDEAARLNEEGGPFAGLDRYDARAAIVDALRASGDLDAETPHALAIGRCDRCDTVVEPRLSTQWFVRSRPLAEPAIRAVKEGRTRIVPERFAKTYFQWLENIRDWNVSRQLWWGHRIPAWYCPDGHITVSDAESGPMRCGTCERDASELRQEDDIFDTWFSSGLWPFSTLGWPDATPDFVRFYPTTLLETGYDIIFFWVARMMMLGIFCTGVEPFQTVYLHGMVRDPYGRKMSKTKGNVADPLEVVNEIGADAMRYALVAGTGPGNDQRLTPGKLDGARNFTNKLWNAARFILADAPGGAHGDHGASAQRTATLAERWIRSRLAQRTEAATRHLDALEVSEYAQSMYDFAWGEYCDWFLELTKVDLRRSDSAPADRSAARAGAADVFADMLRLLHPLMPFVTEEMWTAVAERYPGATRGEPLLAGAAWPKPGVRDMEAETATEQLIELIRRVRALRAEHGVEAGAWLPLAVVPVDGDARDVVTANLPYIEQLARVRPVEIGAATGDRPDAFTAATPLGMISLAVGTPAGADTPVRQLEHVRRGVERLRALLGNEAFVDKAPPSVVERERARLRELEDQMAQLEGPSSG